MDPNFFACDIDSVVLDKAKKLGARIMLDSSDQTEGVRTVIADERIKVDGKEIINAYAFIHFMGDDVPEENGYAYFKIYDLQNNKHLIGDFLDTLKKIGGESDRAFFMKRFDLSQLN